MSEETNEQPQQPQGQPESVPSPYEGQQQPVPEQPYYAQPYNPYEGQTYYQPGYQAPPVPPYQQNAYQNAWGQQQGYQPPTGGPVPPVPPVPPPPAQPYATGVVPDPKPSKQRKWPWVLLGLGIGLLLGLGGCVATGGIMAAHMHDRDQQAYEEYIDDQADAYEDQRGEDLGYNYVDGTYSLEWLKDAFEKHTGEPSAEPSADHVCKAGVYTVGENGQIPAGLYFFEGSDQNVDYFDIYHQAGTDKDSYAMEASIRYLGSYFMDLDEGDVIVFAPTNKEAAFYPAPSTSIDPSMPLINGCYRVGIDIPAGTYEVTGYAESMVAAEGECAAFVMDDLNFTQNSVSETVEVIPGGTKQLTLRDGQYLELYGATATPVESTSDKSDNTKEKDQGSKDAEGSQKSADAGSASGKQHHPEPEKHHS